MICSYSALDQGKDRKIRRLQTNWSPSTPVPSGAEPIRTSTGSSSLRKAWSPSLELAGVEAHAVARGPHGVGHLVHDLADEMGVDHGPRPAPGPQPLREVGQLGLERRLFELQDLPGLDVSQQRDGRDAIKDRVGGLDPLVIVGLEPDPMPEEQLMGPDGVGDAGPGRHVGEVGPREHLQERLCLDEVVNHRGRRHGQDAEVGVTAGGPIEQPLDQLPADRKGLRPRYACGLPAPRRARSGRW